MAQLYLLISATQTQPLNSAVWLPVAAAEASLAFLPQNLLFSRFETSY